MFSEHIDFFLVNLVRDCSECVRAMGEVPTTTKNLLMNYHIRPSGQVAITIYSVADMDDLPIHFVKQLMGITDFIHPR
jgi:hypothetical protein